MMKKILMLILAAFFFVLGVVGLLLPIIPQIPFFVVSLYFAFRAAPEWKDKIRSLKAYRKYLRKYVRRSKVLSSVLGER